MGLRLVFRRRVEQDLVTAHDWYEEQCAGLGEEFLAAVDASLDVVANFPAASAPVHGDTWRIMVSRFPYAVFDRIEPKQVVVLAILHSARHPRTWPRPRKRTRRETSSAGLSVSGNANRRRPAGRGRGPGLIRDLEMPAVP